MEELLLMKDKFEKLKQSRKDATVKYQKKNKERISAYVLKRYHEIYKNDPIFQEKQREMLLAKAQKRKENKGKKEIENI